MSRRKLSSLRFKKIPRKRTDMSPCASPSTFPRWWRGLSEGGKTWRGKLPANIYGSCVLSFFFFFFTPFCFYTSYMFIPAWNLLVNLFSPTAAAHYTGRAVCARKRRGKGGRIPRRLRYHFLMKYGKRGWSLRDRSKEKLVVRNWEGAALPQQWR